MQPSCHPHLNTEPDHVNMPFSIYEAIMLICFGAAWPFSIVRSWRSRTSKGKSIFFLCVVEVGYAAGIMNKITLGQCSGCTC